MPSSSAKKPEMFKLSLEYDRVTGLEGWLTLEGRSQVRLPFYASPIDVASRSPTVTHEVVAQTRRLHPSSEASRALTDKRTMSLAFTVEAQAYVQSPARFHRRPSLAMQC